MILRKYLDGPAYIVRLDDAHPRMNQNQWQKFEEILDRHNIKPIVAVIPSNEDESLNFPIEDLNFWEKVKRWQSKGWEIGIHGFNHIFTSGDPGMVAINNYSEFAGLPLSDQRTKIRKAIQIFNGHGIKPRFFIAPGHSFDINTIKALEIETDIRWISDGISLFPYNQMGFYFVPQQIWRFRRLPFGQWTCAFHPSTSIDAEILLFEKFILKNKKHFLNSFEKPDTNRAKSFLDKIFGNIYFVLLKLKNLNKTPYKIDK